MIGRGRQRKPPGPVPPVLPQIIAEVVSEEHVVLTVNGKRLPATPTRRDELGQAIAGLVARFASPTPRPRRKLPSRRGREAIRALV